MVNEKYIISKKIKIEVADDHFILYDGKEDKMYYYHETIKVLYLKPEDNLFSVFIVFLISLIGNLVSVDGLHHRIAIYDNKYRIKTIPLGENFNSKKLKEVIEIINNKIRER
jgi:hypothetical protein